MKQELNCIDIEQRLIDYAEENLPEVLAPAVALHLESCSACAELVAEAGFLLSSDNVKPSEKAPDSLWRAIQTEINRIDKGRQKQPTLLSTRRPFVSISLRTVGVAAALLLGVYLGSGSIQTAETAELTYEDELIEYYASAFQAESAIPVQEVIIDMHETEEGNQ